MQQQELIPHLFRTEFGRITAVLCRLFGIADVSLAEDVTSETFLEALNSWPYKGVPANPQAWLYTVAKNKAKNILTRKHLFDSKISPGIMAEQLIFEEMNIDLSDNNINDSQLQMLFAICNPTIPQEAQIGLALRILCGFGIDEIAAAFISNKETINKRLFRAKEKLRLDGIKIEFPPDKDLNSRLATVLTALYLLFNEGYYSETDEVVLKQDLCFEAMRLVKMLIDCPSTNKPEVNALFALMCFHASRFKARYNNQGDVVLYGDQDKSLWDIDLINRGIYYLNEASQGERFSKYHLEASIAYWHTMKTDAPAKWENILKLYDHLLIIAYSSAAALNRIYAVGKVHGNEAAIIECQHLNLVNNHFYHTLLGELYKDADTTKAKNHLMRALKLAKTDTDKRTIFNKIDAL